MEFFVLFADIITLIISTFCFVYAVRKINEGAQFFVYLIVFIILILPLYLDYLLGKPDYTAWILGSRNIGFILSYDDGATRIVYDLILLATQGALLGLKSPVQTNTKTVMDALTDTQLKWLKRILTILAMAPIALLLILPLDNQMLFTWGWRDAGLFSYDEGTYYKVERLSYIGLSASLFFLYLGRKKMLSPMTFVMTVFAYMNACIEAKRSILFFAVIFVFALIIGNLSKKGLRRALVVFVIAAVAAVALSVYVKTQYRGYAVDDFATIYGNLRIDYFRDDTVKMLIYSVLNPGSINVLEYPFQSYLTQIGYIFPLDILPIQKLGYNTYFTCALLFQPLSSGLSYTTTSMFDELIANCGVFGFALIPCICVLFARWGDRLPVEFRALLNSCFVLLCMYSLNYVSWYIEVVVILLLVMRARNRHDVKRTR